MGSGERERAGESLNPQLLSPTKPDTKSPLIKLAGHGPASQRRGWHSVQTVELGSVSCIVTSFQTGTRFCLTRHRSREEAGVRGVRPCSVPGTRLGKLRLLGWDLRYLFEQGTSCTVSICPRVSLLSLRTDIGH